MGEHEGFGNESRPILVREIVKEFIDVPSEKDFIKNEFQKRVDDFVVNFLKNINIKITDEHRKFIINHLDKCKKDVKSFEESNILEFYKADKKKDKKFSTVSKFLEKEYKVVEQQYLDLFKTKNVERLNEAHSIVDK